MDMDNDLVKAKEGGDGVGGSGQRGRERGTPALMSTIKIFNNKYYIAIKKEKIHNFYF